MIVDLPAPFSPTMAWMVLAGMERLICLLAVTAPKRFVMPRISMMFLAIGKRLQLVRRDPAKSLYLVLFEPIFGIDLNNSLATELFHVSFNLLVNKLIRKNLLS